MGKYLSSLNIIKLIFYRILIVMNWAKSELGQLPSVRPWLLTSILDNLGVFEGTSEAPTRIGMLVTNLFGQTGPQRT